MGILICGLNGSGKSTVGKALARRIGYRFIDVPKDERTRRVFNRSYEKFGERMLEGGDLYERENSFLSAAQIRPDDYVESWLDGVNISIIRIDGTRPVGENAEYLVSVLKQLQI